MKKRNIMVLMISLSLVLLLGSSYAMLRSTKVGTNPYVINVGTLQVTFEDGKTDSLSLENMYPMSDKEGMNQSDELGFTVKNTGTVESYYDITLEETSTNPEFKSVIRFISNKDGKGYNEPKTLSEDKYIDVGGYLESNASSSYKVKVWLDYNADNTYMSKEFKAKVVVNSFQESEYAKDVIKSKLVKYEESSKEDFGGGLVAVNIDGDLYNETIETQKIREYRYSGPDVNNYVTFNDELWRIIGVFKDEKGNENVKIVRNEVLPANILPDTYNVNEKTFLIRYSVSHSGGYFDYDGTNYDNNWNDAGLMYWLNSKGLTNGYLKILSSDAQSMITETKYYLGTLTYNTDVYIMDTPKEAYQYERAIKGCIDGKGPSTNNSSTAVEKNSNCRVWANNAATWTGKIGLLYPSDYGLAISNRYWNIKMTKDDFSTLAVNNNWIKNDANSTNHEWFLSPSSSSFTHVAHLHENGYVGWCYTRSAHGIRPVLYLKSNVKITSGDGTSEQPYQLEI